MKIDNEACYTLTVHNAQHHVKSVQGYASINTLNELLSKYMKDNYIVRLHSNNDLALVYWCVGKGGEQDLVTLAKN